VAAAIKLTAVTPFSAQSPQQVVAAVERVPVAYLRAQMVALAAAVLVAAAQAAQATRHQFPRRKATMAGQETAHLVPLLVAAVEAAAAQVLLEQQTQLQSTAVMVGLVQHQASLVHP
jgi:hypothetical protein